MNKVYGLLGICAKSGNVVSGMDVTIENVKNKKVKLVIVASDCSEKTKKNIAFICEKNNVPICVFGMIEELSKSIGKINRGIIGIKNESFTKEIIKIIYGGGTSGEN